MIKIQTKLSFNVDTKSDLYYGVECRGSHARGFITMPEYKKGEFQTRCFKSMTVANNWAPSSTTLVGLLEILVSGTLFDVYQFNTYQELLEWGSEEIPLYT